MYEFQHYTSENGLSSNWVHVILQDSRDFMWFGTDNGLCRFDGYEFVNYYHDPEDSASLPFSFVSALLENQNKNLWVGMTGVESLFYFDPHKKTTTVFSHQHSPGSFSAKSVNHVFEDSRKNIWIACVDRGLALFNRKTREFTYYSHHDLDPKSIATNDIHYIYEDKQGNFWIGLKYKGLDFIPIGSGKHFHTVRSIPGKQNTFTFRYVVLNYINSEKNQYAYMLEGLDTDWNDVGTRREAVYTNIQPGKYTFRVKASNNDGLWNEQGESIDLIISPPFWKTRWMKAIVSTFRHQADAKKIQYQFHSFLDSVRFLFDPDKIEKVLVNIISNAVKFTQSQGSVDIFPDLDRSSSKGVPSEESPAPFIRIQVKDTGPGIAPVQLRQLFKPFYQVPQGNKKSWQGSGIDLSLTKELVELHHGIIYAESEPEKGTTLTVRLPIIEQTEVSADHMEIKSDWQIQDNGIPDSLKDPLRHDQSEEPFLKNNSSPLILIVEDDADFSQYLKAEIGDHYSIIYASDGLAGYELAVDQLPDIIICDAVMPGLNGYELTLRCKNDAKTSHIPIIMMTAQESKENLKKGLQSGVDDYVTKPFDPDLLKIRIDNLLESRRKMRERLSREIHLHPQEISLNSLDDQFIQKLIQVTEQYLSDPHFSVDDLGYHVGLSRAQLYRKMHSLINHTPNDFIQTYRLERAKQLLEKGMPPSQVAYQTGFNDPSYFSKCFKKQFHQSPTKIRNK